VGIRRVQRKQWYAPKQINPMRRILRYISPDAHPRFGVYAEVSSLGRVKRDDWVVVRDQA
jgi:hypothetical protein